MVHVKHASTLSYHQLIMPRVLQPGGLSGKMLVRYTASRKLGLRASAKRIMDEEGVGLCRAAERLQVAHSRFMKWQQQQRAADDGPILAMLKTRRKSSGAGPLGQLKPLEDALLRHIFEQREQGIVVHTFNVVVKASSLSPEFNTKNFIARSVDVGFNKPFKDRVRRQWMSWMISEGIIHETTSSPTRLDVAGWVDRAMTEMKEEVGIVRNAWSKMGYELFAKERRGAQDGNDIEGNI
jgi:hypothetical protein